MNRFVMIVFFASLIGVTAVVWTAEPTTNQATSRAAARAKELSAAIDSFGLTLRYHGKQLEPYGGLTLIVHEGEVDRKNNPSHPVVIITKPQAEKIIDHLASEGFLDAATNTELMDVVPPEGPCYTMMSIYKDDRGVQRELYEVLGWGMPLLKRLDGLRSVLDGDAARSMDLLLGRMSAHRREWTAEADDAIEALRVRLSADPSWQDGTAPVVDLPPTASAEQVVSKVFETISFDPGPVTRHKIITEKAVVIAGGHPDHFTAVLVETNLGEKIVLLGYQGEVLGWWGQVYESERPKPAAPAGRARPANEQD